MRQFCMEIMAMAALLLTFASCDSVVYDDEGDCSVTYRLQFRYDWNMKFADAFPHEVGSVAVYAFDKTTGKLLWQKTDKGDALARDGYTMALDLPAGDYDLVAWCGLDNDTAAESFSVPQLSVGSSSLSDLGCSLRRQHDSEGRAYVDSDLFGLYHGQLSVSLPQDDDGGDYLYTMPLVKDTNHLRVILQHLSGKDVDVQDFSFTLDGANGLMGYDNALLEDENITYRAWNTESGQAGVETDSGAQTAVSVAIADLTTGRLTEDCPLYLTIRNGEGKTVVRVPFVDYALLVKGYYNRSMSNQEYLDRQDEWSMTFFLDEAGEWISSSILINSWRVVLQSQDIK